MAAGAGGAAFATRPWELYATWGVMVGIGSGAGMVGMATAVANRWFVARRGLVVGLLTASNASGQLVFLPLLASLAEHLGWQSVPWLVALVILALIPIVALVLAESPGSVGLGPYGAAAEPPIVRSTANPDGGRGVRPGARRALGWTSGCCSRASRSAGSPPTGWWRRTSFRIASITAFPR